MQKFIMNKMRYFFCTLLLMVSGLVLWAENVPRAEYPRPQFERQEWQNLNGTWTYSFDFGVTGESRGWQNSNGFEGRINVPFCPESPISCPSDSKSISAKAVPRSIRPDAKTVARTS